MEYESIIAKTYYNRISLYFIICYFNNQFNKTNSLRGNNFTHFIIKKEECF